MVAQRSPRCSPRSLKAPWDFRGLGLRGLTGLGFRGLGVREECRVFSDYL